jgi:hypothetical protein
VIFAVGGVSSLAGAAVARHGERLGGVGTALVLSVAVRAGGALCMPLAANVSPVGVALLVANQLITDPAWTFYEINELSLRQSVTPDRLQGRMHAGMRVIEFGAMLLGTLVGGVVAQLWGPRTALFLAVAGTLTAALWLAVSPVRRLRSLPVVVQPSPAEAAR